jgi:hypothetical protein
MTLDKTRYSLSENMTISFYLRNISNETVTLMMPDQSPAPPGSVITAAEGVTILPENLLTGLYHFGTILYSSNGTVIENDAVGWIPATYDIILQPNASLNQTEFDNFAFTVDENGRVTQRALGPYEISGVLYASMTGTPPFGWYTPSITFTLVSSERWGAVLEYLGRQLFASQSRRIFDATLVIIALICVACTLIGRHYLRLKLQDGRSSRLLLLVMVLSTLAGTARGSIVLA